MFSSCSQQPRMVIDTEISGLFFTSFRLLRQVGVKSKYESNILSIDCPIAVKTCSEDAKTK